MSPAEAISRVNESVVVEMVVQRTKCCTGSRQVFLDSEANHRDPKNLGVVVTEDGRAKFSAAGRSSCPSTCRRGRARSTSRIARSAVARTSYTSKLMTTVTCGCGRKESRMLPLYEDPCFTFRFADDRIIPRFHLEGVESGRRVSVFQIDPGTGERMGLLATATVGEGCWVDLPEPIIVRAGEAFIVVPDQVE